MTPTPPGRTAWSLLLAKGLLVAMGTSVLACDMETETVHPTSENLPHRRDYLVTSDSIPAGMSPQALSEWRDARSALLNVRRVAEIGRLGAGAVDDPHVFGLIADVELDEHGNVYVLDRHNAQVRIFDSRGTFVAAIGKPGQGPGEFRDPSALELLPNGRVAVADRGAALKVFTPTEEGYQVESSVQLSLAPEGMCAHGNRVFAAGWQRSSDAIIHRASAASNGRRRSFGRGYRSESWLVQDQLSDGRIACLGDPVRVVFAFELLPVLRGYDARDGTLAWEVGIDGYAQMKITETTSADGQAAVSFSAREVQDNLVSVTRVASSHVLLQYLRGNPQDVRSGAAEPSTRTYLVDAATGRGALIDALPLVAAMDSVRQVAMWLLPYPRLEVRAALSHPTGESFR